MKNRTQIVFKVQSSLKIDPDIFFIDPDIYCYVLNQHRDCITMEQPLQVEGKGSNIYCWTQMILKKFFIIFRTFIVVPDIYFIVPDIYCIYVLS